MNSLLSRLPPSLRRLFLYALCGGSGVLLDFSAYSVLVVAGTWYQLANIVGYALGTILSFFLNRAITFDIRDATARRFIIFLGVAFLGYIASSAMLALMVDGLGMNALVSKVLTLFVVLLVQFSLNSLITFRPGAAGLKKPACSS